MKNKKKIQAYLMRIGLIPKYTEVSLFLTSLILILLLFISGEFRNFVLEMISGKGGLIFSVIMVVGITASIFFTFSSKKPNVCKPNILIFMILTNSLIAIEAGGYALRNTREGLAIFPILNMMYAFLSMVMLRVDLIDENSLPDQDAKMHEVVMGTIVLIVVVILSHYIFKNYWAMTFSIALTYATMASEKVAGIFFKETRNNSQKTI